VFEVINSVNTEHKFSVGLIIGGKNLAFEKQHIQAISILICTPGRLIQHIEETPGFEINNLQVLVIDEVDLLLELGFRETLDAIVT